MHCVNSTTLHLISHFCQLPRAMLFLLLLTLPFVASNVPFVSQRLDLIAFHLVLASELGFVDTMFKYQSHSAWSRASSCLLTLKSLNVIPFRTSVLLLLTSCS